METMWKAIETQREADDFMERFSALHDSCIQKMQYISGAYADENLAMYPVNDQRRLRVTIQRQFRDAPVIELEFSGLRWLKLFPADEDYTCEILDTTLLLRDGCVLWADRGGLTDAGPDGCPGTVICASNLRWRVAET